MKRISIADWIYEKIRSAIAIVQDGDTATRTIASGKYVIWKGVQCKAKAAIPSGTTLSSTNLEAVPDGGLNELDSDIETLNSNKANAIINAHSTLGTDLNTYTTTGMYGIEGATNCPTGYAYGTLTVTRYSSSAYVAQTWQSVIEEKIFIRHSFNGTWQPWEELALNSKIPNLGGNLVSISKESDTQLTSAFVIPYPTGFNNQCFVIGYSTYDSGQWYTNDGLQSIYGVSTGINCNPKTSGWNVTKVRVLLCKLS